MPLISHGTCSVKLQKAAAVVEIVELTHNIVIGGTHTHFRLKIVCTKGGGSYFWELSTVATAVKLHSRCTNASSNGLPHFDTVFRFICINSPLDDIPTLQYFTVTKP